MRGPEGYTDYLIGERLGQRTIKRYVRWVREAEEWLAHRGVSLADASATLIARFAEERVTNSHPSRGQATAALGHYWDMIRRHDAPRRAIRVPPQPEMVCRAISEDDARALVEVASGWWPQGAAVLCGMYLALRRFEIAKMEWGRFSTERSWYTVTGKYDKTATLPVHPRLVSELEGRKNGTRWVFPGRFDGPVNPATVWDWVREVGQAAGIDNLVPHELRHTSLATANDRTGNLRAVQTFARHSKPSTTSGYTRTTADRLREVSDALEF